MFYSRKLRDDLLNLMRAYTHKISHSRCHHRIRQIKFTNQLQIFLVKKYNIIQKHFPCIPINSQICVIILQGKTNNFWRDRFVFFEIFHNGWIISIQNKEIFRFLILKNSEFGIIILIQEFI